MLLAPERAIHCLLVLPNSPEKILPPDFLPKLNLGARGCGGNRPCQAGDLWTSWSNKTWSCRSTTAAPSPHFLLYFLGELAKSMKSHGTMMCLKAFFQLLHVKVFFFFFFFWSLFTVYLCEWGICIQNLCCCCCSRLGVRVCQWKHIIKCENVAVFYWVCSEKVQLRSDLLIIWCVIGQEFWEKLDLRAEQ